MEPRIKLLLSHFMGYWCQRAGIQGATLSPREDGGERGKDEASG